MNIYRTLSSVVFIAGLAFSLGCGGGDPSSEGTVSEELTSATADMPMCSAIGGECIVLATQKQCSLKGRCGPPIPSAARFHRRRAGLRAEFVSPAAA